MSPELPNLLREGERMTRLIYFEQNKTNNNKQNVKQTNKKIAYMLEKEQEEVYTGKPLHFLTIR